ncbi:hypothetical protein DU478_07265 [Thalassococcus profundi]|uniref:Uncharacterized protein n=1 Tax=Thalassococcus profundi TaxID=2282382 RepID=A0A369TUY0_9RHOB|nr:hypothetical protein [Thalassococcus profundi]RDD66746.1 hypothetical protein DU478_07265 [Thalassococcus profundi]
MPTGYAKEVVLGTDPQVRVYIFEDEGNLFFQVEPDDPANFDLDGVFFNLTNDAVASDLVIFPLVNQEAVTGFSANADSENSLSNGATTQDNYDVKVQFGQTADSTSGTVGTGFFTFYLDSLNPLTAEDIDLSSLTAVVNSDDGAGQVLLAGVPGSGPVQEIAFEFDPSGVYHPADSSGIASDARWYMSNGKLTANGCYDGALTFEEVDSDGPVTFELTGKINKAYNFENSGWLEDQLHVQVQIDGGHWVTLDTFEVDYHQKALVGNQTGQKLGENLSDLTYSGGILDTVEDNAQFRVVADFTSSDEVVQFSDVTITTTDDPTEDEIAFSEDFNHVWHPTHSDAVVGRTDWDVQYNALATDGYDDGELYFKEVETDGDVEFSFDARTDCARYFENSGRDADSFKVEVQIDDGDWVTLDNFVVNDKGTALVGSETGQEITDHGNAITYSGGILDTASENVQFRFVSDISAANEDIRIDNVELKIKGEPAQEEVPPSQYDILFTPLEDTPEDAPAEEEDHEEEMYA